MLTQQIEYYNQLPDNEKWIVNMATLMTTDIGTNVIYRNQPVYKGIRGLKQPRITQILGECEKLKILTKPDRYCGYQVDLEFMFYIMPLLTDYRQEWETVIKETHSWLRDNPAKSLRNYLYSILFNQQDISKYEMEVLRHGPEYFKYFKIVFVQEKYKPVMSRFNRSMILSAVKSQISERLGTLTPLDQLVDDAFREYDDAGFFINLMQANFAKVIEYPKADNQEAAVLFYEAIQTVCRENDTAKALDLFEKGMKKQRAYVKTAPLPFDAITAFYYLGVLLSMEAERYSPVLTKIISALEKKQYTSHDDYFLAMCKYTLKSKNEINTTILHIQTQTLSCVKGSYQELWSIITLGFIGEKPTSPNLKQFYDLARKAYENGYLLLALEVAYTVNEWMKTPETEALYAEVRDRLGFEAVLSRIGRQEDWEKSLNLLLGLNTGGKNAGGKQAQAENRVVYEINFASKSVQPILQKWQAKGWSTGRNIAMKTLYEGNVAGMTEQDYRVSKCIKHHKDYYYESYEFQHKVFKELAGHPYLFLSGSKNIPVELIAGEPAIQVSKTGKGYRITSDVPSFADDVCIQKETNTRYKVIALTDTQRAFIQVVNTHSITVPEKGKEKLSKVLSHFSSQLAVHSDLVQAESQSVKTVKPDSRIRVQLLPFGDGLKAELFAKPFGEHPPYCKPGVGGKTLIYNQQGVQLQVTRDLGKETEYANTLFNDIQSLESIDTNDDLIAFDHPTDALYLLSILEKHPDISVVEWPEGERFKIRKNIDFSNLSLKLKGVNNWFELQGEVQVDEKTVISIQQLLTMSAQSKNRFVELKEGEFLALSAQLKKRLDELASFSKPGKNSLQINKFASAAMDGFFTGFDNLKADKAWRDFQNKLQNAKNSTFAVPDSLQAELRPYQEEGFRWLARLSEWDAGACLADDMGLGKTVQSLAILLHRSALGPAMVVAPMSVIPNWISEIRKFSPGLNVKTLNNGGRKEIVDSLEAGDVLITSYGLLQSEEELLCKPAWASVVLDEAHTIKNYNTKTSKAAMSLNAAFKLALTGTPIQNHLGEIWNLFNFINPGLLGSLPDFNDRFVKPESEYAQKHLKHLVAPFILRRTKSVVLDELPPKTEIIKKIQLSAEETAFYEALRRQAIANLESDDSNAGAKHIKALAEITRLRQASCNTALVKPEVTIPSTKLATFMEIVSELKANNHRALVFSQFVSHLALVRKELDAQKVKYLYLDGSTSLADREKLVKRFQACETDLFLISLKAGGLGLNLTAADFVIHLDPWWNPAIEDQASDRAHRIGQSRPVTVYRLVSENTIEEKIIELHNSKRDLADSLLEGSDQSARLSTTELLELIRNA